MEKKKTFRKKNVSGLLLVWPNTFVWWCCCTQAQSALVRGRELNLHHGCNRVCRRGEVTQALMRNSWRQTLCAQRASWLTYTLRTHQWTVVWTAAKGTCCRPKCSVQGVAQPSLPRTDVCGSLGCAAALPRRHLICIITDNNASWPTYDLVIFPSTYSDLWLMIKITFFWMENLPL